jgi:hypothetical protein
MATVFSLVAVIAAIGLLFDKLAAGKNEAIAALHSDITPQETKSQRFGSALAELKKRQKESEQVVGWLGQRYYWADAMTELRNVMIKVEAGMKNQFRTDTGIWIEEFLTAAQRVEDPNAAAGSDGSAAQSAGPSQAEQMAAFRRRYGLDRGAPAAAPAPAAEPAAAPDASGGGATTTARVRKPKNTNEISSVTVKFRAVSLGFVSPEANKELFFSLLKEIRANPFFDAEATEPDNKGISAEEAPGTFTFGIVVGLKDPLKL